MVNILTAVQFGNPILRENAQSLSKTEIVSSDIQSLIANMRYTLTEKQYGVGIAAPQVDVSVALSVIGIKPTPTRPELTAFDSVIINPKIIETYGKRSQMWEGCISCGTGDNTLYALVPRYKRIKMQWLDEHAIAHEEILEGFVAHVAQHEVDHLNGILFVDRVKDTKSYIMADEYRKQFAKK